MRYAVKALASASFLIRRCETEQQAKTVLDVMGGALQEVWEVELKSGVGSTNDAKAFWDEVERRLVASKDIHQLIVELSPTYLRVKFQPNNAVQMVSIALGFAAPHAPPPDNWADDLRHV